MSKISLTLPSGERVCTGKQITFSAPCNSDNVTCLVIGGIDYTICDSSGNDIGGKSQVWSANTMVSVVLDSANCKAYVLTSNLQQGILPQIIVTITPNYEVHVESMYGESRDIELISIVQNPSLSLAYYTFNVPAYGTYKIYATSESGVSTDNYQVVVSSSKQYYLNLSDATGNYHEYGIRINTTNMSISYIDQIDGKDIASKGKTPGSSWDNEPLFKNIKPCILKDGEVLTYLNPNNFAQDIDGNTVDISASSDGDVMIEFPKGGYKFIQNGKYLDIYVTDNPNAKGYCYHSFSYKDEGDCSKFYWGAYLGSFDDGTVLRSVSAATLPGNANAYSKKDYVLYAQSKGIGYHIASYYQFLWIQLLYLLRYKDVDSQSTVGMGYVSQGSTGSVAHTTGITDSAGMISGDPELTSTAVKLFGIEDMWGNPYCILDGIYKYYGRVLTEYPGNCSTVLSSVGTYRISNKLEWSSSSPSSGWLTKVQGTNDLGFLPTEVTSSYEGYNFKDYCRNSASYGVLCIGGLHAETEDLKYRHGIFSVGFIYTEESTKVHTRLSYCYPESDSAENEYVLSDAQIIEISGRLQNMDSEIDEKSALITF